MEFWKTTLQITLNEQTIQSDPIMIRRGIFQGDSLSPLWFCLAINPLYDVLNSCNYEFNIRINNQRENRISHLLYMDDIKIYASTQNQLTNLLNLTEQFSGDIGMSFGIEKCKTQAIRKGVFHQLPHITQNKEIIEAQERNDTYKYLGFCQSSHINHTKTKTQLKDQYVARLKLKLKTQLNGKNLMKAVNTFCVPLLTYSFGVIKWSKTDLENLNIATRKIFTQYRRHHPKSSIERFSLPRQNGGRGFQNLENLYQRQISDLKKYFLKRAERNEMFRTITRADLNHTPLNLSNTEEIHTPNTIDKIISGLKQKQLHGKFYKDLEENHVNKKMSLIWLKKSSLYAETEGFVFAIQDQVINTKNYRKYIIKNPNIKNDCCRLCKAKPETIQHIISSCSILAQTDYKARHDNAAKIIHKELATLMNLIEDTTPYYTYIPSPFFENNKYKLYWDRTILTDLNITANRPDIILIKKHTNEAILIDIAIPNTNNIIQTYDTKISKYLQLSIEMKSMLNLKKFQFYP
ncbi:hypothetical protein Zmor_004714 [Zophobas morio]|uniref:Reverse transcriptase domain-containing protein n=1 Tax=Zophobas morio TaxID=2755281 RepID=A0AA38IRW5_9CUCU|nr:hypothetical protein Zmor_004714 [Zophobas morio]